MHALRFRDERGIVGDWLLKVILFVFLLGVVVVDGGAIAMNFFGLDSKADEIAVSVATSVSQRRTTLDTPHLLEAEAEALAKEAGAKLLEFELDETERFVRVKIRRSATTFVVRRIGPIKDWTRATAEGRSGF